MPEVENYKLVAEAAEAAYNAWGEGLSREGVRMVSWPDLPLDLRDRWRNAFVCGVEHLLELGWVPHSIQPVTQPPADKSAENQDLLAEPVNPAKEK